jgi:hypothetical protein
MRRRQFSCIGRNGRVHIFLQQIWGVDSSVLCSQLVSPLEWLVIGLLTPASCFPFTSPPLRRFVPSHSNRGILDSIFRHAMETNIFVLEISLNSQHFSSVRLAHHQRCFRSVVFNLGYAYPRDTCWERRGTLPSHCECLSDYPQLPRHLWTDAPVHDETCRGVHWILWRTFWALIINVLFPAMNHKFNVSWHMLIWTFCLVLVRGTRFQSLWTLFSYILYFMKIHSAPLELLHDDRPRQTDRCIFPTFRRERAKC